MIETILALPVLLLLCGFAVETSRALALRIGLDAATQDLAESLSLRWTELSDRGLLREGASNAADLAPELTRSLSADFLESIARLPGFSPLSNPGQKANGRVFIDLDRGRILRIRAHVCLSSWIFGAANGGASENNLAPRALPFRGGSPSAARDCGGRFVRGLPFAPLTLRSNATLPLPPSHFVYRHGLALPAVLPFSSDPPPSASLFALGSPGPTWDALLLRAAELANSLAEHAMPAEFSAAAGGQDAK